MAFNVNRFRENIASYGYAKQNKFEVFVQSPRIFQNSSMNINGRELNFNDINNLLRYRIEETSTPTISLLSSDVHRYAIGPTQKMPYNAQYTDLSFTIIADRNADLWDFWYTWVNSIFNFNGYEPSGNNLITGRRIPTYTSKYKEEYSTIMMIVIYNDVGETIKTINLYDAFPSSVREIPLSWADRSSIMRLAVSITYSMYTIVGTNVANNAQPPTNRSSATRSGSILINA